MTFCRVTPMFTMFLNRIVNEISTLLYDLLQSDSHIYHVLLEQDC